MYDLIVQYLMALVQVMPWAIALRIIFDLFCGIIFDKRF